jgi:hypothetical protein
MLLTLTKFRNAKHCDKDALIPYDRVDTFIIGECSNVCSAELGFISREERNELLAP